MACKLCDKRVSPYDPLAVKESLAPCRHEKEDAKPTLAWRDTTPEVESLVADFQDVLSVSKQRGIAKKHLDDAYQRGFNAAVKEATNAIRHVHAVD